MNSLYGLSLRRLHEKGRIDTLISEHMNRYLFKAN